MLDEAHRNGLEFIEMIKNHVERIEIAGSIRRCKPQVGDVELVCIPKIERTEHITLAGTTERAYDALRERMLNLWGRGIVKRNRGSKDGRIAPFGPKFYRITHKNVPIDLFVVTPPADWFPIFVIRTGSADFSHFLVTKSQENAMHFIGGHMERVLHRGGQVLQRSIIVPASERQLFEICGIDYLEPWEREASGGACLFPKVAVG
jgi:DNA polymerase/3'-5' exonuclease PolX